MGRPSWANKEQTAWLWSRHAEFVEARTLRARNKGSKKEEDNENPFFSKTYQAFFDKFGKPPPPADGQAVLDEDGNELDPVQTRKDVSNKDGL